jgi:aspartate racemase
MGPAATADFYAKLVRATPSASDQGHIRTLIWSDPSIPDRTAALLSGGPDPTPALVAGAFLLRAAGASIIAVPCNTAHAFLGAVETQVGVPFVDMIENTARRIRSDYPLVSRVGLLSTTGTRQSLLYDNALRRHGLEPLVPSDSSQERYVTKAINRVKAGLVDAYTTRLVTSATRELVGAGAELIIAGCTELPIAFERVALAVPVIDPTQVLAEAVVAAVFTENEGELVSFAPRTA